MNPGLPIVELVCAVLFFASLLLFLITGARRRKLDLALREAAVARGVPRNAPQLLLFGEWLPHSQVVLAQPERRWTYDQDYMVAFIEALRGRRLSEHRHEASGLGFYSDGILNIDIAFAVFFACFIVCAAFLFAQWCAALPWLARFWIWSGCMGVLYGVADVAEDVKLRQIFRHAERLTAMRAAEALPDPDTMLADAAQVDASNTLTRVKLITIVLSLTGFVAFGLFFIADKIASGFGAPSSGRPVAAAGGH